MYGSFNRRRLPGRIRALTMLVLFVGFSCIGLSYARLAADRALAQDRSADKPVSFMDHIAPLLKENCFACHDAKKRKGKLDLTTFEGLMKGGDRGAAVVPGKPEESFLWTLTSGTESPAMPPKEAGGLLPKDKVALIERWIRQGAKYDGQSPTEDLVTALRRRWQPPIPPAAYRLPQAIRSLVFTPDGKKLIVGGYHELLVWDPGTGTLEARVRTRAERTNAMVWLRDGKTLAVAGGRPGQEGDVRLYRFDWLRRGTAPQTWDGTRAQAGVLVRELLETADEVLCLALSADGRRLAAGGCDRSIRVWDMDADGKLLGTIENHADWVLGLAFSPDGKYLLSASRDKTAKVWDLTANEALLTMPAHQAAVYTVLARPDGKIAASAGEDNQIRLWTLNNEGKTVRNLSGHSKAILRLMHHPSKPWLISAGADKTVRIWDAEKGQTLRTLAGHRDWVFALAISPDASLLASGSYDGEVRIWHMTDGTLVRSFIAAPGVKSAAR